MSRRTRPRALHVLHWAPLLLCAALVLLAADGQNAPYYPEPDDWERKPPEEVRMDSEALQAAIRFAVANETPVSRDLAAFLLSDDEPFNRLIGPTRPRGGVSGLVIRHGYIVAEWGDVHRVDMTFSVTKSFLSSVAGLAWDRGMIRDIHDPVRGYVPTDHFHSPHNQPITWDHLLRQTSEWEGSLWGIADWQDRPVDDDPAAWPERPLREPGKHWKYNDVRVNLLALSLLHLWRDPLPKILRKHIMDPIGASNTWRWYGYENSWVTIDGLRMQSVSGGGHWGGGIFINALDLGRFGLLTLRRGRWAGETILSEEWIAMATTPTAVNSTYGFMNWFLNTDRRLLPGSPETALLHAGGGVNLVYVSPDHDLVIVVRWIDGAVRDEFFELVLAAIE